MLDLEGPRAAICDAVDRAAPRLTAIADHIHANPELGFKEFEATRLLTAALEEHGARVERGVAGMETAFLGWLHGAEPRPCVGLIAEYDALPAIGHACGHNLIGTAALGAIAGLAAVAEQLPGSVVVIGSPAEEGGGGKVFLLERGALDNVDAILGVHPRGGPRNLIATEPGTGSSLARAILDVGFHGKAAHAAANPFEGINALDAVVQTYTGISVLRQQLRPEARIHGIITHGGAVPNVIPDFAAARFYVRARSRTYLAELIERVKRIAEGAALQTGATFEITQPVPAYDNAKANATLGRAFARNMAAVGLEVESHDRPAANSSTDFGNLSQRVPAASAKFSISEERIPNHSIQMRDAARSDLGRQALITIAKAYALTAYDVLVEPGLLVQAKREFDGGAPH
jgi:amidohydrolase